MYTTLTRKTPWNERAANAISQIAAAVVSLVRPISSTVTESGAKKDVLVLTMSNARMSRIAAWVTTPSDTAGCLHIDVLGHYIQVWFARAAAIEEAKPRSS